MNNRRDIISEFLRIRDIPYRIPLSLKEPDQCCSGKATELLNVFIGAGYETRYRVCTFRWSDMAIPQDVLKAPHEDNSTHVYLEVKIDNAWKNLDPTWDKGLQGKLPVNNWDGRSDTQIAVPVGELFSLEESAKIMSEANDLKLFDKDMKTNGEFYKSLNGWLASVRLAGGV